jgi:hypothetical protein
MKRSQFGQYVDDLLEIVISRTIPKGPNRSSISNLAREIWSTDCRNKKAVIFGCGTGLSTVFGGTPGLTTGPKTHAWYLKHAYGETMEYEMSLLRWSPKKLEMNDSVFLNLEPCKNVVTVRPKSCPEQKQVHA